MGHKDDLFGGFFDFNGDGKTSFDEEFIGMQILDDIDKSMREEFSSWDDDYDYTPQSYKPAARNYTPAPQNCTPVTPNNSIPPKRFNTHEENMEALKIVVIVLVTAVLFPLVAFGINTAISQSKYNSAERLFYAGRYEEARSAFRDLSSFKDADSYEFMCLALIDYIHGDIADAYDCMCRTKFYYLDAEEATEITAQMNTISDEYKQYVEKIKADEEKAKYYDGRLRNKYDVPMTYNYFTPVTTATSYVYKPSKPSKPDDDPYNAKDFSNAEDFYDFHYYDFIDYYDAENYYREHCD